MGRDGEGAGGVRRERAQRRRVAKRCDRRPNNLRKDKGIGGGGEGGDERVDRTGGWGRARKARTMRLAVVTPLARPALMSELAKTISPSLTVRSSSLLSRQRRGERGKGARMNTLVLLLLLRMVWRPVPKTRKRWRGRREGGMEAKDRFNSSETSRLKPFPLWMDPPARPPAKFRSTSTTSIERLLPPSTPERKD